MKQILFATLLVFVSTGAARALPQLSVESGYACNTCHVEPMNWPNPELKHRKCSLNCNACHVNPTGGGMRHESGIFFSRQELGINGDRPSDNPVVPDDVPPPGSDERCGGIPRNPTVQVGADLRLMRYGKENEDSNMFPMQTDIHLALRPYNPRELNQGRVTVLATVGAEGSRDQEFKNFQDRYFIKELWGLYHDLPYQLYVKGGRFLPAFGWRLDDHTAFIRQGQGFDNERQVTGIEAGVNPNFLYAHFSVYDHGPLGGGRGFNSLGDADQDHGLGTALTAGWRELLWQAGGSLMFESRDERSDLWVGSNWAFNFHKVRHGLKRWQWAPVTYLGEIDLWRQAPDGVDATNGLSAFHEVDYRLAHGVRLLGRYDWQDPDIDFKDDHKDRVTVGFVVTPFHWLEWIGQYRINGEAGESVENNDYLMQFHVFH